MAQAVARNKPTALVVSALVCTLLGLVLHLSTPVLCAILLLHVAAEAALAKRGKAAAPATPASTQPNLPPVERVSRECGLSLREREVLASYLETRDVRQSANELFISPGTVKAHLSHIYKKVGVNGRIELLDLCDDLAMAA